MVISMDDHMTSDHLYILLKIQLHDKNIRIKQSGKNLKILLFYYFLNNISIYKFDVFYFKKINYLKYYSLVEIFCCNYINKEFTC